MLKKLGLAIGGLLGVAIIVLFILGQIWDAPGDELTPAGCKRNSAHYIEMADGVEVAVELWLPESLAIGARIPAVVEGTRYWRAMGLTSIGRVAAMLGVALRGIEPSANSAFFTDNGYAMITVDVRGTGASGGVHKTEYSLEEIADYWHVIEWVQQQPWSSGEVFAVGISYGGTSAELMTTVGHPALKAVAPLYADFDAQMQLATPGGLYQPAFIELWSEMVAAMDRNDVCGVISVGSPDASCLVPELLISGVKPVDGAERHLSIAVAEHASPNVAEMVQQLNFRDSAWGASEVHPSENSPFGLKTEIERANVPMFVVTGWYDAATTDGALARFATFNNPQEVWVGAFSHGGGSDTDPYKPVDAPSRFARTTQLEKVLSFFERYRTEAPSAASYGKVLNYYVNGADQFMQTTVWPPTHLSSQSFYLGPHNTLQDTLPGAREFDRYTVDFSAGTASTSRWLTQLGGTDVVYNQRAEMSTRLLSYSSALFEADTELTGSVVLDLWMTSSRTEAALHAYLEDVAPDGGIRYLTEGVLNLRHRANTKRPAYPVFGPTHSFLQEDAAPLPVGQVFSVSTTLYATSAVIKAGHRLRLSLAGADATSFARLPETGETPKWHVYHGPTTPSAITVQTAPWLHTEELQAEEVHAEEVQPEESPLSE